MAEEEEEEEEEEEQEEEQEEEEEVEVLRFQVRQHCLQEHERHQGQQQQACQCSYQISTFQT